MTRIDRISHHAPAFSWHSDTSREGGAENPGGRAALFGALGLGSGVVSDLLGWWDGLPYPALPGVYFGLVLVACLALWGRARPLGLLCVFAATNLAWWSAFETSAQLYSPIQDWSSVPAFWCGLLSGLLGSAITFGGVALACRGRIGRAAWLRTLAIGGLAGTLLQFIDIGGGTEAPLMLAWQAAVAASIGYGLAPAPRSR